MWCVQASGEVKSGTMSLAYGLVMCCGLWADYAVLWVDCAVLCA